MTDNTNAPEVKETQTEETTNTPEVKEASGAEEAPAEAKQEAQTQEAPEKTEPSVAELHTEAEEAPKKKPDSVPLKKFIKEKDRRKELEKRIKELEADDDSDDPSSDDDDGDDNAEVQKLADELEQIKLRDRQRQLNEAFDKGFQQTLENTPEYKDVVNPEIIRQMAFNPANKAKTYKQLIEEAYGNALKGGQQTVETTTPRGGAKDSKLDLKRAETDAEYRKEVLKDPDLKKQYNEGLTDRIAI